MVPFHSGYDSAKECSKAIREWLIIPAPISHLVQTAGVPGTDQECFSTELLCQSLTGIAEIAKQARGWERGSTIMMLSQKSCRSSCQSAEDEMGAGRRSRSLQCSCSKWEGNVVGKTCWGCSKLLIAGHLFTKVSRICFSSFESAAAASMMLWGWVEWTPDVEGVFRSLQDCRNEFEQECRAAC